MSGEQRAATRMAPIEARGLTKSYHGRAVVDHIDLTVLPGEIYGFLGPNGAGKTTTMRMLLGLVAPDAGAIRLFGRDLRTDSLAAREGIAGIIEEPRLYTYLSGRTNLRMLAALDRQGVGDAEIEQVLEVVELRERGGDRVSEYSQGMRQRLGIAACLVRRPRLLMLDEPANGLDPAGIRYLRALLSRLSNDGMTVLLSSHLLAEVQAVCDRVAIVSRGQIVHEGELEALLERTERRYTLATPDAAAARELAERVPGVSTGAAEPEGLMVTVADDEALFGLTRALTDAELLIQALVPEQLTLENVFFALTESPAVPAVPSMS